MAVLKKPAKALTDTSKLSLLQTQEQLLKDGLAAQSQALKEIRDNKLYEAKGFSDFSSYCRDEWGYSESMVTRQIVAGNTRMRIESNCPEETAAVPIVKEGQLRVLADVDDKALEAVIDEAAELANEKGCKVTATVLKKAKEKVLGKPATESIDKLSTPAPEPSDGSGLDAVELRAKELIADRLRSLRLQLGNLLLAQKLEPHLQAIEKAVAEV